MFSGVSLHCFDDLVGESNLSPLLVWLLSAMVPSLLYSQKCSFPFSFKLQEQQQGGVVDEAEPFMGSGRFGMF